MQIAAAEADLVPAGTHLSNSGMRRPWRSSLRDSIHRPEWPLVMLFVGYPVWWLLGITQFAMVAFCGVMGLRLLRVRRPVAPLGFRLWLTFLAWAVLGILVLQVEASGSVPGASSNRYLTWALRLVWFIEATVVMLYVTNVRRRMGPERTARILAAFFVMITIGGVIGSLAPAITIRSLAELVVPHLSSNAFVSSLVHPVFAERQSYLGSVQYRPSAPFSYANRWGLNYACFLPIFVYSWCGKTAGWRRIVAPIVLLTSIVPVIYSMNRGLWAAMVAMLIVAILKQARGGHVRPMIMLTIGAAVVVAVVAVSPLGTALMGRFSGHNSNEGRTTLSLRSLGSVAEGSPIVGFGTTRDVQGSFFSIAAGKSPSCPYCSPPSFGTQGSLWSLTFDQGLVGGAIGLGFFVTAAVRHRKRKEPVAVAYLCTLTAFLATTAIYDWSETASFAVMAAIASLGSIASDSGVASNRRSMREGLQPMAGLGSPGVLVVCCVLGATVGAAWQAYRGPTYEATTAVYLPEAPVASGVEPGDESTLDTQAQMIAALQPPDAERKNELGRYRSPDSVTISAEPNTRILDITYKSASARSAVTAVREMANEAIQHRTARLESEHRTQTLQTQRQAQEVSNALMAIDEVSTLTTDGKLNGDFTLSPALREKRSNLEIEQGNLQVRLEDLATVSLTGGQIVRPAKVNTQPAQWSLAIGSGAGLGILLAVLIGSFRSARGVVLGKVPDSDLRRNFSGLAIYRLRQDAALSELRERFVAPLGCRQSLCLGPRTDRTIFVSDRIGQGCQVTAVSAAIAPGAPAAGRRVIAVVSSIAHTSQLANEITRLRSSGIELAGVVIVDR